VAHKTERQPLSSPAAWIASFGGIGLLPIMPGTWCSLLVALPALLLPYEWEELTRLGYLIFFFTIVSTGWWSITRIQLRWGHDPSIVVVDEAMGMALILVLPYAYMGWWWWCGAVLLFRIYDVMKPWPISWMNARTESWAVWADDVLAGVFAIITLGVGFYMLQLLTIGMIGLSGQNAP